MKSLGALVWTTVAAAILANMTARGAEPSPKPTLPEDAAVGATAAKPADSEGTPSPDGNHESPLRIELTVYAWLSSLESEVTVRDSETTSEIGLGDILDALDFASFAHLEVQKGKWGAFSELDLIKLSNDAEFRNPREGIPFKIHADGVIKLTMVELGAIRTFQGSRVGFDALIGARYFRLVSDVNVGPFDSHVSKDWVDPMVGARLRLRLNDRWNASLRGDLAGFGVGSKLTTNIIGALSYSISDRYAIAFGYRYLDIDYEKDAIEMSTTTYGPVVGMTIRF